MRAQVVRNPPICDGSPLATKYNRKHADACAGAVRKFKRVDVDMGKYDREYEAFRIFEQVRK